MHTCLTAIYTNKVFNCNFTCIITLLFGFLKQAGKSKHRVFVHIHMIIKTLSGCHKRYVKYVKYFRFASSSSSCLLLIDKTFIKSTSLCKRISTPRTASLCVAVDSLPLVLKLLCVTQASDPPSSSPCSKMDGVHFKLLYHGEVNRCCWQVTLSVALLPTALIH